MRADRGDLAYAGGLVLGGVALVALGLTAAWADLATHNDFAEYWIGSRALLDGRDPYEPSGWPQLLATVGRAPSSAAYSYPPYVAAALVPFALLPVDAASLAFTALGVAVAVIAQRALLRAAAVPHVARLVFGFALVAAPASLTTFAQGQLSFVLFAALGFASIARQIPAALAALVLAAKPQVFLFAAWSIVAAAWHARRVRFLAVVAVGVVAVLASVALAPRPWTEWWQVVSPLATTQPPRMATLLALGNAVAPGDAGRYLAAGLVVVLVLAAIARAPHGDHPLWLALTFVAAPYAQRHDHVALLVPLALAAGAFARRSARTAIAVTLAGTIALVPLAAALYAIGLPTGGDPFGVLVPLAILGLVAFAPR